MKKVTKSIAAIAVIFGSFVVGGNAALAISLPPTPIDPVVIPVIPEVDGPEFSGPGSFDMSMTAELDTHCDEDDGIVTITIENNLSDQIQKKILKKAAVYSKDLEEVRKKRRPKKQWGGDGR